MASYYLPYKDSLIHYLKSGKGQRLLFCFHGYGESAASFHLMEEKLSGAFTMIAIDLPFHGRTEWRQGLTFLPWDLQEIMAGIIKENALIEPKMTLAGYSMGGRIALSMLSLIPDQIDKLVLMAPDGLKMNGWYWLATQNQMGNQLFKFTMLHPGWFLKMLKLANSARLVNQSIYKFAISYLQDRQVRMDLYHRWTTMRLFKPDPKKIKHLVLEKKIDVELIYGRFDRMIRYETGQAFVEGTGQQCRLTILHAGHQLLHAKTIDSIVPLFYS